METTKKTFLGVFGNRYELEIASREKVCNVLDYQLDQEEVLQKLLGKHVKGTRTEALFNIESCEVEYHTFIGNSDLQQRAHLIELYSIEGSAEEGLSIDDFLNEDEIEEAGDYPWEYIENLEDYEKRLFDAYVFHWSGFNEASIRERISEIYND